MELLARVTIVQNQPPVVHNPNGTARPLGVFLDRDDGDLSLLNFPTAASLGDTLGQANHVANNEHEI